MNIKEFNGLSSSREKWNLVGRISGEWECPNCKSRLDSPRRCSPFAGSSIHCSNCEYELTRRTGGGQLDPFKWKLKTLSNFITDEKLKEEELVKKFTSLKTGCDNAYKSLKKFRDSVKDSCTHPEGFIDSYQEDRDDGYGKWWKVNVKRCDICGKVNSSGRWIERFNKSDS